MKLSDSVALMKPWGGLTMGDVLLLELPMIPDEKMRMDVLWEYTGWPEFFAGPLHWFVELRRQLVDFREGRANSL